MSHQSISLLPGTIHRTAFSSHSSDALYIAELSKQSKPLMVITANALDAIRLMDEIPFFHPICRFICYPTGKHCLTILSLRIMTLSLNACRRYIRS